MLEEELKLKRFAQEIDIYLSDRRINRLGSHYHSQLGPYYCNK